jgi:hypothetical protein
MSTYLKTSEALILLGLKGVENLVVALFAPLLTNFDKRFCTFLYIFKLFLHIALYGFYLPFKQLVVFWYRNTHQNTQKRF